MEGQKEEQNALVKMSGDKTWTRTAMERETTAGRRRWKGRTRERATKNATKGM